MLGTAALGDWPSWQGPAEGCVAVIPWPLQEVLRQAWLGWCRTDRTALPPTGPRNRPTSLVSGRQMP